LLTGNNLRHSGVFGARYRRGFTLLELTVVLFILVLGFAAIAINLATGSDATALKGAARDIVSALRYARGRALMTRSETTVTFDFAENTYTITGRDDAYSIPESIDVTMVTAQQELSEGTGSVRFYPDGSSSGGRVTLEEGSHAWRVDINWLTGLAELEETDAEN
jgi:general secretion pathway protein H